MKKNKKNYNYQTISFRAPRNLASRLKRAADVQGLSQTGIIIRELERGLWRWEKEHARKMKERQEILKAMEYGDETDPAE